MKVNRVLGGNPARGIEFNQLIQWNCLANKRSGIKPEIPEININAFDDPFNQIPKLFHSRT
jgi:hypothetical protein